MFVCVGFALGLFGEVDFAVGLLMELLNLTNEESSGIIFKIPYQQQNAGCSRNAL